MLQNYSLKITFSYLSLVSKVIKSESVDILTQSLDSKDLTDFFRYNKYEAVEKLIFYYFRHKSKSLLSNNGVAMLWIIMFCTIHSKFELKKVHLCRAYFYISISKIQNLLIVLIFTMLVDTFLQILMNEYPYCF